MNRVFSVWLAVFFFLGLAAAPVMAEEPGDQAASALLKTVKPAEDLLPEGATVVDEFEPGDGPVIGMVDIVQGRSGLVYRGSTNRAYRSAESPGTDGLLPRGGRRRFRAEGCCRIAPARQ